MSAQQAPEHAALPQSTGSAGCFALCPTKLEQSSLDIAKDFASVAGPLLGVAVLFFGILQYRVAQKWKKNEFAASILKELNTDEDLVACCNVLDYPKRRIVLAHLKTPDDKTIILEHDRSKLAAAMTTWPPDDGFEAEQIVYRDLFDRMFSYLSQVGQACSQKLITPAYVRSLHYWLEKILDVHGVADATVLAGFVKQYHPGVIALAKLFEEQRLLSTAGVQALRRWTEPQAS